MELKKRRWFIYLLIASCSGLFGLAGGTVIGASYMRDVIWELARTSMIADGNLAYTTLVLLEEGDTDALYYLLESEIDGTLSYLESVSESQEDLLEPLERQVYERLKRYRQEHPRPVAPEPIAGEG
jgi:hypothetical protein